MIPGQWVLFKENIERATILPWKQINAIFCNVYHLHVYNHFLQSIMEVTEISWSTTHVKKHGRTLKVCLLLLKQLRVLTLFFKEYELKMLFHCDELSICNCTTCSKFMMNCKHLFKTSSGPCFVRNHSIVLYEFNKLSNQQLQKIKWSAFLHTIQAPSC